MPPFDAIEQLPTWQQLHANVEWIFRLVDSFQTHEIAVLAGTHNLDLVDQSTNSILLSCDRLLQKCFYSILAAIFVALNKVDRGERPAADLFEWSEELMKAILVETSSEDVSPKGEVPCLLGMSQLKALLFLWEFNRINISESPPTLFRNFSP